MVDLYSDRVEFRALPGTNEFVKMLVEKYPDLYPSESQFWRTAFALYRRRLQRDGIYAGGDI